MLNAILLLAPLTLHAPQEAAAPTVEDAVAEAPATPKLAEAMTPWAPLIGEWQGSGDVFMAPNTEGMPWTAEATFAPVLGGFIVEERMTVHAGPIGDMEFRTWYGHDRERNSHHMIGLGADGPASWARVRWAGPNTVIFTSFLEREGQVISDRSVYTIAESGWSFTMYRSIDGAPEFVHAAGTFQPPADGESVELETTWADAPTGELAKLQPLVGRWSIQGKIAPMPGMGQMELKGEETIRVGTGGHYLFHHIQGGVAGGPQYEAFAASYWDPAYQGYGLLMVDNMGGIASSFGRMVDERTIVYAADAPYMGTPNAQRTKLTIGEDGTLAVETDALMGTRACERTFDAVYSRQSPDPR